MTPDFNQYPERQEEWLRKLGSATHVGTHPSLMIFLPFSVVYAQDDLCLLCTHMAAMLDVWHFPPAEELVVKHATAQHRVCAPVTQGHSLWDTPAPHCPDDGKGEMHSLEPRPVALVDQTAR